MAFLIDYLQGKYILYNIICLIDPTYSDQGLFIGCFIDTSTGIISFTCEGKETRQKFRMEPGMKLFPAVFVKATSKDALQYELGRTSTRDGSRSATELLDKAFL